MEIIYKYLLFIPGVIITVGMHEYVKALASTRLGDTLPKRDKRLTMNLFRHIDPLGFIFMLFYGFGWGKPVNTSATFYKNRKSGTLIVYILPILTNVILSIIFIFASQFVFSLITIESLANNNLQFKILVRLYQVLDCCAVFNITFAIFSLIPIHPLAGSKILGALLNPRASINFQNYEKILQIILVLLIVFGFMGDLIAPISDKFINNFAKLFVF